MFSGDEEEESAVISQVLDEIGIEISGKLSDAPSAHKGGLGAETIAKKNKETIQILHLGLGKPQKKFFF